MPSLRTLIAVAAMASVAAGCTRETAPAQPAPAIPTSATAPPAPLVGYACESGRTVTVQYPDTATAQISYQGQTSILRTAPAATGARYVGPALAWATVTRDGQEQASLSRLGPNADVGAAVLERCSRPTPGTDSPVAPNGPLPGAPGGALPIGLPCRSGQLKLSNEGGDAGMGNRVAVIGLQNLGPQDCSLTGYPMITLVDTQGRTLTSVRSEQNPGNYFHNGAGPTSVSLAPQSKAYFDLAWNVVPNEAIGQTVCPSVATVQVAAPNDTAIVSLGQAFTPCGGRVRISPIRPTASDEPAAT